MPWKYWKPLTSRMDDTEESDPPNTEECMKILKHFDISVIGDENPLHTAQQQLSDALNEEKSVIVIKDPRLRTRTAIHANIGECLHHVVLVAAVGSIICSSGVRKNLNCFGKPLAVASVVVNIGYWKIWKRCPLSNYRVATGPSLCKMLKNEPQPDTTLVRKVEARTSLVHTAFSVAAVAIAFWKDISAFGRNFVKAVRDSEGGKEGSEKTEKGEDSPNKKSDEGVKGAFKRRELDHIQV